MKMIVGLGNPGKSYDKHRHNIGFQCVDLFAARHGLCFDINKGKARVALGTVHLSLAGRVEQATPLGEQEGGGAGRTAAGSRDQGLLPQVVQSLASRVLLVKPQTFMNLAGQSVAALARFYRIAPADILVILDDLDLPLGKLRLRPSGGSGGHNGMKSIIRELGSDQFPRLRIGIDRPPGRMDPAAYVLQDFTPQQEEVMAQAREMAVTACEHWLAHGIDSAMNAFN